MGRQLQIFVLKVYTYETMKQNKNKSKQYLLYFHCADESNSDISLPAEEISEERSDDETISETTSEQER